MIRGVKPWHMLPREVGDGPSLETLMVGLDWALSNLIQLEMSLLMGGGLDCMALKVPPNPNYVIL